MDDGAESVKIALHGKWPGLVEETVLKTAGVNSPLGFDSLRYRFIGAMVY